MTVALEDPHRASVADRPSLAERWADRLLVLSPLQAWYRRRHRAGLRVLAYHGVDDPASLAAHLEWTRRHGALMAPDQVLAALAERRELPPGATLITFDDGQRSVFDAGLAVLRRFDARAVVFVVADLIGSSRPFWWDEVGELLSRGGDPGAGFPREARALVGRLKGVPDGARRATLERLRATAENPEVHAHQLGAAELGELRRAGWTIGNHTASHPCLDRCEPAVVEAEITRAHERLADLLGAPPWTFAYPNGDYTPDAERVLSGLGYTAAFLFDHRTSSWPPARPLAISRLRVNSTTSLDRFRLITSGLHPALLRLRGLS